MSEGKSNRLMLIARLIGFIALYVASITLLFWVGVHFGGMLPASAVGQATVLIAIPANGCIRWARQIQAKSNKPQLVHEGIFFSGLSLILAGCLLLTGGQPWWLLSIGVGVWSVTAYSLFVHIVFADAITRFLVKHKLATKADAKPKPHNETNKAKR